jgi:hypothetical protein
VHRAHFWFIPQQGTSIFLPPIQWKGIHHFHSHESVVIFKLGHWATSRYWSSQYFAQNEFYFSFSDLLYSRFQQEWSPVSLCAICSNFGYCWHVAGCELKRFLVSNPPLLGRIWGKLYLFNLSSIMHFPLQLKYSWAAIKSNWPRITRNRVGQVVNTDSKKKKEFCCFGRCSTLVVIENQSKTFADDALLDETFPLQRTQFFSPGFLWMHVCYGDCQMKQTVVFDDGLLSILPTFFFSPS